MVPANTTSTTKIGWPERKNEEGECVCLFDNIQNMPKSLFHTYGRHPCSRSDRHDSTCSGAQHPCHDIAPESVGDTLGRSGRLVGGCPPPSRLHSFVAQPVLNRLESSRRLSRVASGGACGGSSPSSPPSKMVLVLVAHRHIPGL